MSEEYRFASGWDNTFEDTEPFLIQPRCVEGVVAAQRDIAVDLSPQELGLHAVLEWQVIDGEEDLQALLDQLNLESFRRQQITAWLPGYGRVWHLYNCWINRPRVIPYEFFPQNLRMICNKIVQIG